MKTTLLRELPESGSIPVYFADPDTLETLSPELPALSANWIVANGFEAGAGEICLVPDADGNLATVLFGLGYPNSAKRTPFLPGLLPGLLPSGTYHFANAPDDGPLAALAFGLGSYAYSKYKSDPGKTGVALVVNSELDCDEIICLAEGVTLARDLINTPSNDMGPQELADVAQELAKVHGGTTKIILGDELLEQNFPMIHAVGRASTRAPRLIDMHWGDENAPKITLVGKGVCFDTGGLDIKPAAGMLIMKKDMGGAANVLGLASMIMSAGLNIRLRVLVPSVENSISGNAFRPGDILESRKGISVEIGNTDAEGRLVLADALTLAGEETPELVIDMATLTGAARVALGPDLSPAYSDDTELMGEILAASDDTFDPIWHMPLWRGYEEDLSSGIADINHISSGGFAGSVTAALFLKRFAEGAKSWVHFDIYGWTPKPKPARPVGGEGQAIRALFEVLKRRYGKK